MNILQTIKFGLGELVLAPLAYFDPKKVLLMICLVKDWIKLALCLLTLATMCALFLGMCYLIMIMSELIYQGLLYMVLRIF